MEWNHYHCELSFLKNVWRNLTASLKGRISSKEQAFSIWRAAVSFSVTPNRNTRSHTAYHVWWIPKLVDAMALESAVLESMPSRKVLAGAVAFIGWRNHHTIKQCNECRVSGSVVLRWNHAEGCASPQICELSQCSTISLNKGVLH